MPHQPTGRLFYGAFLALTTAVFWGVLPISLKIALTQMDAYSIVFFRFGGAAVLLLVWLVAKKRLPPVHRLTWSFAVMLIIAALGLLLNYIFYNLGLELLNPETAQVLIQVAPFFVMVGGVLLFNEPFSHLQKLGSLLLLLGLVAFFNKNLARLVSDFSDYTFGVLLIFIAAVTWAVYALLQKFLLKKFSSMQLMFLFYCLGSICFAPLAEVSKLLEMSFLPLMMLVFCILNTFIAYGTFAAAMEHIHATQVSAIVTLAPLFTFAAMFFAIELWPTYFVEGKINVLAYIGGALVVFGSVLVALGKKKSPN